MQRTNLFDYIKIVLLFAMTHESVPQLPFKLITALRHILENIHLVKFKIHGDVSQLVTFTSFKISNVKMPFKLIPKC